MDELKKYAWEYFKINITNSQIRSFETYERELLLWNKKSNLTAIRSPEKIRSKHFLDSISCLKIINLFSGTKLIDIGTGAGFPGIPLKIIKPFIDLTLVDSVSKKTRFCEHIVKHLKLEKTSIVTQRSESLGRNLEFRECFDVVTARAVARLPTLVEYLLPLTRLGGTVIIMKGESAHVEVHDGEKSIKLMGGRLKKIHSYTLPGVTEERNLIQIEKIVSTPEIYPRRIGIPGKKPILN